MSTRWHIGAKHLRGAITAYAKRFDLLEVRVVADDPESRDAPPGPNLATLRRWRKSVPPHFDFAVVAGPQLSRAKAGPAADREFDAARAAIDTLEARCFVLHTPPEVTPTSLWRDRIGKIVSRLPRDVTHFVWEPSGLWETPDAAGQARDWGVVLAMDPTREAVPPGPVAYLRLRAMGETQAFGPAALEKVVQSVGSSHREVFAILETDTAMQEAKRLRLLARRARPAAGGGGARLVRPRGGIVVRDDEQE